MKNQRGMTTTVIIIIVAAAAAVVGAWLLYINMDETTNTNTVIENTNTSNANTNTVVNKNSFGDTENWETYASDVYGYSIQYPDTWTSSDLAKSQSLLTPLEIIKII